ncbi:deoxynucleoside triphosphate triphosphohydrolase SAMHD1-like [Ptychodera flava]|uniref:deoxynucleoside triphosphate triphosphohydrolase SAMHD1-like n=1 Tax=Ptychodera flava TaxID=63121 RepID=UPI003969E424
MGMVYKCSSSKKLHIIENQKKERNVRIADATAAAAPYLKRRKENGEAVGMSEILHDMDAYMTLDDTMYTEILKSHDDEKLMEARSTLQRIQKRELYKLVCKVELPANLTEQDIKQEDIIASSANDGSLKEDDLRLMIINMDYGVGDKNPFDDMLFYSKDDAAPRYALPDEISHLIPKTFQERRLFVYVTDYHKKDIATRCVDEWARESGVIKPPQPKIPGTSQYTDSEDHAPGQTGIKRKVEESHGDERVSKMGKFDETGE